MHLLNVSFYKLIVACSIHVLLQPMLFYIKAIQLGNEMVSNNESVDCNILASNNKHGTKIPPALIKHTKQCFFFVNCGVLIIACELSLL